MTAPRIHFLIVLTCLLVVGCSAWYGAKRGSDHTDGTPSTADTPRVAVLPEPTPIAEFVSKGIEWLVEAQHEDGGWGAGSHSNQQLRDPHAVQVDPATTAFTTMALLRAGHTPVDGRFQATVRRALEYLCGVVEVAPDEGPRVTHLEGTQPQSKLGQMIDTMMTVRTLSRALPTIPSDDPLHQRVDQSLDKALDKLEKSQQADGSWGGGTWAGCLQSALGCTALEFAQAAGKKIDLSLLANAREHQKDNFNLAAGSASAPDSAGVELYAQAGSQRGSAGEARAANDLIDAAKKRGDLAEYADVTVDNLKRIGVDAPRAELLADANDRNRGMIGRLQDESILAGFGSNGGEEYLSYLLTSESMFLSGGNDWGKWDQLIHTRLAAIQSADGSWTGHHCITSPVFCTAAVVQCLTTDRDVELLAKIAANASAETARK